MQTCYTDITVCLSVVTTISPAKTAELIELLSAYDSRGARNDVLDGGTRWHHLVNNIECSNAQ